MPTLPLPGAHGRPTTLAAVMFTPLLQNMVIFVSISDISHK